MSHYPSTAELAAFRRRIHNRASNHGLWEPCITDDTIPTVWRGERENGIGYLETAPDAMCIVIPDGAVHTGAIARRRAGVLRTRAYAASLCPVCGVSDIPDGPGCACYGA